MARSPYRITGPIRRIEARPAVTSTHITTDEEFVCGQTGIDKYQRDNLRRKKDFLRIFIVNYRPSFQQAKEEKEQEASGRYIPR